VAARLSGRRLQKLRAEVAAEESVCWLCGRLIDKTLPAMHPAAFEIDHIVPHAFGGPDDRTNLRAAHRLCNQRRGTRPPETITPNQSRDW